MRIGTAPTAKPTSTRWLSLADLEAGPVVSVIVDSGVVDPVTGTALVELAPEPGAVVDTGVPTTLRVGMGELRLLAVRTRLLDPVQLPHLTGLHHLELQITGDVRRDELQREPRRLS